MRINNKILITIFIWALVTYFYGLNIDFYGGVLFWAPLITMIIIIVYQIFYLDFYDYRYVLAEIFMTCLFLHLVYQVGYLGLRGSDSYSDYVFFKSIVYNGHFDLSSNNIGFINVSGWPILHILSASLQLISGIGLLEIAKYFTSFISSIIILPVYVLANTLYNNKKVSLLSCLILCTIPQFINFEALFVRESIALFILPLIFYTIITSRHRDTRFTFLFLILLTVLIFSHHFASFIFIIFLLIYLLVSKIVPFLNKKRSNFLKNQININTLFLLCLVALLGYWMYCAAHIWTNIGLYINNLVGVETLKTYASQVSLNSPIITLYGKILYYGFFIFYGLLSLIFLFKLYVEKHEEKIEDISFTLFLFFSGFYAFLGTFLMGSLILPTRLFSYGWIFGVIPLSGFILTLKRYSKVYQKLFFVFLIFFMLFNIYNIDPSVINKDFSSLGNARAQEYTIANTIIFPTSFTQSNGMELYYGYSGVGGPIYDSQGILLSQGVDIVNFKNYKKYFKVNIKIAILNENLISNDLDTLKLKSIDNYNFIISILSLKDEIGVNKIADLGDTYILT